jgi:hypothetical protein
MLQQNELASTSKMEQLLAGDSEQIPHTTIDDAVRVIESAFWMRHGGFPSISSQLKIATGILMAFVTN